MVATPSPLRVWLEPGYDKGRVGLWMLDWPGLFVWGDDISSVMSAAPKRATDHVAWLRLHGEANLEEPGEQVVVVQVISARENENATFRQDLGQLTQDEFESALRHAAYAQADLVAAVRASDVALTDLGDSEDRPRTVDQVVRHVALSELWLATRLKQSILPSTNGLNNLELLDLTHQWAISQLGLQFVGPERVAVVMQQKEPWTMRKVLRRFAYHVRDHSEEIARRVRTGAPALPR